MRWAYDAGQLHRLLGCEAAAVSHCLNYRHWTRRPTPVPSRRSSHIPPSVAVGSHQAASIPRISFGDRLLKRGNVFYVPVRIPQALHDLYAATGLHSEACDTLKTTEPREAERRCRERMG